MQAQEVPQALGIVAQRAPVPVTCENGRCEAVLTAFCLQPERKTPDHETAYRPSGKGDLALIATLADGSRVTLPTEALDLTTRFGYSAVRAAVRPGATAGLAVTSLAIEVKPRATLFPVAKPGETRPFTAAEIADVTGPKRALAEATIERNEVRAEAAKVANALMNTLPLERDILPAQRAPLMAKVAALAEAEGISAAGLARGRQAYAACQRLVDQSGRLTLRDCLEGRHQELMRDVNEDFWRQLGGM
jgi:hypothetical protein